MPWKIGNLDDGGRIVDTRDLPNTIPDYEDDDHVFFANVAYALTAEEVMGGLTQDRAPRLEASNVVGIRIMCGRCGLVPTHLDLIAVNGDCPGEQE